MGSNVRKFLSLMLIAGSATAHAAGYEESRCQELRTKWGAGPVPNLEGQAASNLRKWVLRCNPELQTVLAQNQTVSYTNPDGGITKRVVYPVFGKMTTVPDPKAEEGVRIETSNPANYKINPLAVTSPATAPCDLPKDYTIVSWCVASCYTPDQVVLLPEGFESIRASLLAKRTAVMTLRSEATLDNLNYESNEVRGWTVSLVDEEHAMVQIKMRSGGSLKVTLNHPLVDSKGQVRSSSTFKIGDQLVRMDGSFDPIVEIKKGTYFGKVYNVDVASANRFRNIVVAQGYLNGSVMYQNEGAKFLNRVLLRSSIARLAL